MNRLFKNSFISWFLILGSLQAQQNLVPNWSFEEISQCPHYFSNQPTIVYATPWQNPNIGTADLYSSCDIIVNTGFNAPGCGVPENVGGYQNPKSGNNYAGILAWGKPSGTQNNIREYVDVQLSDSLKSNKKYCVSFFVSIADTSSQYSTSRIGGYISKGAVNVTGQFLISVNPQITNPFNSFLTDNINWTAIQGLYTAIGGENYITIGNFFDDANTDTLQILNNNSERSYYYIDDVSLVEYNNAYAGRDSTICAGVKIKQNLTSTFGAQYNWSVLSGDANSIDSINAVAPTLSPSVTTTYVLQKQQCGIISYDTLHVKMPTLYPAKIGNDTTICIGDTVFLSAVNNCNWCNHWWNTGAHSLQISVEPQSASTYQFYQTDSCRTTNDAITVNVEYCKSPVITAPNIFSPNADQINDVWQPIIINELSISKYNLTIYNRWGLNVFETDKYNNGWDGHTTSGTECSEGTYFYVIEYTDAKTKENTILKGFLTLVN